MDTKALRQKILDLAIRGKLVPQDPNDEPASALLERIRAEKQQMVKDGKLKPKDIKNDTVIFKGDDNLHYEQYADGTVKCIEDEIPFDVPEGWEWCRLTSICSLISDIDHKMPKAVDDGVLFLSAKDLLNDGTINYSDNIKMISEEDFLRLSKKALPQKNDIIYSRIGACLGKARVVTKDILFLVSYSCCIIRPVVIDSIFLATILDGNFVLDQAKKGTQSVGVPDLGMASIKQFLVPIPPLAEQQRIDEQLQSALNIVQQISIECDNLGLIITQTKSKILDLAIRGKLVPQDPNDEPASVLLERIKSEKEELIKQGKIKRDKKESVIFKGDDNSYYQNLPENWEVTTLRELTSSLTLNDGDWILSENMTANGEVKLLQLGSIGNMIYIDNGFKYLTKSTFNKLSCTEIFPGYLLINRIISDKMCCCIVPDIAGTIITTVDTCWIAPSNTSYNVKFLMYQLASPIFQSVVLLNATGTTRKRISKNNLINLQLLLPPLAEQKRIIEAIETIFAELDKISKQVT